jgi:hypothetical protein
MYFDWMLEFGLRLWVLPFKTSRDSPAVWYTRQSSKHSQSYHPDIGEPSPTSSVYWHLRSAGSMHYHEMSTPALSCITRLFSKRYRFHYRTAFCEAVWLLIRRHAAFTALQVASLWM